MSALSCGCDPDYVGEQGYDQGKSGWVCAMHQRDIDEARIKHSSGPMLSGDFSPTVKPVRQFDSGATRNIDTAKFDFEGFLNPEALHAFGEYMHEHRLQRDGTVRDADNWQKGIPLKVYIKSLVRHTIDLWRMDRGYEVINPDTGLPQTKKALCAAITFNAMGYLKELVDPAPINQAAVTETPRKPFAHEKGCCLQNTLPPGYICERERGHTGQHMAWDCYPDKLYENGVWL